MTAQAAGFSGTPGRFARWRGLAQAHAPRLQLALMVMVLGMLASLPWKDGTKSFRGVATVGIPLLAGLLAWAGVLSGEPARRFLKPLAAVFVAIALSTILSMAPGYSLSAILAEILPNTALFLGVLVWSSRDEGARRWAVRAVAGSALAACAATIHLYLNGKEVYESITSTGARFVRAEGTLESYSRMAMFCVLAAPCCAVLVVVGVRARRWWEVALGVAALGATLSALGLTQTRGAWLACAGSLFVLLFQVRRIAALGLLVLVVAGALAVPGVRARAATFISDANRPNLLLSGRLTIWKTGIQAIRENPATGIGYGPNIYRQEAVQARYLLKNEHQVQSDLHNTYLQQFSEVGLIGVAAYAFLLGTLAVQIGRGRPWQAARRFGELSEGRLITLATGLSLAGLLTYALVHNPNEERAATLFWMLAGVAAAGAHTMLGNEREVSPGT